MMKREMPRRSRQYMIDLQRWRSIIALIACSVTMLFTILSIRQSVIHYVRQGWIVGDYFRYFTTLSNIMTALAASFIVPFAINGIRFKRFVYPKWLARMHYAGTVGTTMTMVFSLVFILPRDPVFAIGGNHLFLHVICPIGVLISFELVENGRPYTRKDNLLSLIPFLTYSILYVFMVVVLGEEQGGWEDLYLLNTLVPIYVSMPCVWLLAGGISCALRAIFNRLNRIRTEKLLGTWRDDLTPVEIKIEVFGLGRYYGLHGEKNDLSLPYDILEAFSKRYAIDIDELVKAYTKGLLDGVKENQARS